MLGSERSAAALVVGRRLDDLAGSVHVEEGYSREISGMDFDPMEVHAVEFAEDGDAAWHDGCGCRVLLVDANSKQKFKGRVYSIGVLA